MRRGPHAASAGALASTARDGLPWVARAAPPRERLARTDGWTTREGPLRQQLRASSPPNQALELPRLQLEGVSGAAARQNKQCAKRGRLLNETSSDGSPARGKAQNVKTSLGTAMMVNKFLRKSRSKLSPGDLPELTPEEFEDLKRQLGLTEQQVTKALHEIQKSKDREKMRHARKQEEDPEDAEEERKRLAKERRERQKENEARNPKKRIQSRTEEFIDFPENFAHVPQIPVISHGLGTDRHEMVSVARIQAKLTPSEGGVQRMVDTMAAHENAAGQIDWMSRSLSAPNFLKENKRHLERYRPDEVRRFIEARAQAEDEHVLRVLKQRRALMREKLGRKTFLAGMASTTGPMCEDGPWGRKVLCQRWLQVLLVCQAAQALRAKLAVRKEQIAIAMSFENRVPDPEAVRLWDLLRRVLKVWMVFRRIRRRHRSADVIATFLKCMGEAARVKVNVMRSVNAVRRLQRTARLYLERQRLRAVLLEKQWTRVEDRHLQVTVKEQSKRVAEEARRVREEQAKRRGSVAAKQLQKEMVDIPMKPNMWMEYRIPPPIRMKAIRGMISFRLREYVKNLAMWVKVNEEAVAAQKELMDYIDSLGAEKPTRDEIEDVVKPPAPPLRDFWSMTDDDCLDLIVLTGADYKGVSPIHDTRRRPSCATLRGTNRHMTTAAATARGAAAGPKLELRVERRSKTDPGPAKPLSLDACLREEDLALEGPLLQAEVAAAAVSPRTRRDLLEEPEGRFGDEHIPPGSRGRQRARFAQDT